jgi:hypothetical protein
MEQENNKLFAQNVNYWPEVVKTENLLISILTYARENTLNVTQMDKYNQIVKKKYKGTVVFFSNKCRCHCNCDKNRNCYY